jgi:hypothetical protein
MTAALSRSEPSGSLKSDYLRGRRRPSSRLPPIQVPVSPIGPFPRVTERERLTERKGASNRRYGWCERSRVRSGHARRTGCSVCARRACPYLRRRCFDSCCRPSARILRVPGEIEIEEWKCLSELIDTAFDDFNEHGFIILELAARRCRFSLCASIASARVQCLRHCCGRVPSVSAAVVSRTAQPCFETAPFPSCHIS